MWISINGQSIQGNKMKLLTLNQIKMLKSSKKGYLSAILNLQPAYKYKNNQTCPSATKGCKSACLQYCGRNRFDLALNARIRRTKLYYDDKTTFYEYLISDIEALIRKAKRENKLPSVRLNGLSDIPFENDTIIHNGISHSNIFELFKEVQFIDYTKIPNRMMSKSIPDNYHLTYSYNEGTPKRLYKEIYRSTRFNMAVVFNDTLPDMFLGYPVIDGDLSDLRHLDKKGSIVGLKLKKPYSKSTGKLKVLNNNDFVQAIE